MRLINTTTLEIREFFDSQLRDGNIEYAILSHCWEPGEYGEVSYQEFLHNQKILSSHQLENGTSKELETVTERMKKITDCCDLAKEAGLEWAWIDTCCIDKTSSAELSEAINSMFLWYRLSKKCFVFLKDFISSPGNSPIERLCDCKWWTRGWTLQELLAPRDVQFYDLRLKLIGSKESMVEKIEAITGIPADCLVGRNQLRDYSVAQRMSWASHRKTTRIEDIAYCLLGIFEVNIPLLYGEGTKSFQRLQEAIISRSDDESIFAWLSSDDDERGMLAASPSEYACTGNIKPIHYERKRPPSIFTSRGLQVSYAFPDPALMMFEKVSEATFGGAVFKPSRTRELRLDCEFTDAAGYDCWIGISLCRDVTTGNWYRQDAKKLLIARQNGYIRRIYPPLVGYERIDVEPFVHYTRPENKSLAGSTYSEYTRPVWLAVVYQVAETLVALFDLWLFSGIHHILGLAPPNPLLSWAYLTAIWVLTGSNPSVLASCLLFGLCGLDFVTTFPRLNIFFALSGFVAMNFLQYAFEKMVWKDLDRGVLKRNIGKEGLMGLQRRKTGPWSQ